MGFAAMEASTATSPRGEGNHVLYSLVSGKTGKKIPGLRDGVVHMKLSNQLYFSKLSSTLHAPFPIGYVF